MRTPSRGRQSVNPPAGLLGSRVLGGVLGGAVGDALGAPVEFMRRNEILSRFGADGLTDFSPAFGKLGAITDDTQMTLFTLEGLVRGAARLTDPGAPDFLETISESYLRWLLTQGEFSALTKSLGLSAREGWLLRHRDLFQRRAPGVTCLSALRQMHALGQFADNDSKGCGGVMRVAPVGMLGAIWSGRWSIAETFDLGRDVARITHGHPTGYLTGGVLSAVVHRLVLGDSLMLAMDQAIAILKTRKHHEETLAAIEKALALAASQRTPEECIRELGEGWIAEEALAISVYAALVGRDFRGALTLAVNHDGDSDSTGAIAGNILGARDGVAAIPSRWIEALELSSVIKVMSMELLQVATAEPIGTS